MGGEKSASMSCWALALGSPPHGRGKAQRGPEHLAATGITPAWAGKSAALATTDKATKDHPRMGGEKVSVELSADAYEGSPPHGRGKD